MPVEKIVLLGAGKIGAAIIEFLASTGDYRLTVADHDPALLEAVRREGVTCDHLDFTDATALRRCLEGSHVVVSAVPHFLNAAIAQAARDTGLHYFDLTEDVATTRLARDLADGASSAFMPQCGLAPGFISIVAMDLARRFDRLASVRMRVGALPQFPTNALAYNLTWSTDGLINEYCNPCEAIRGGRRVEVPPLEGFERFSLDGVSYEAFNTSGGLGTLCETLDGRVDDLDYKTVRYPGHCDYMRLLVRELKLGQRRDIFKDVLESAIPATTQDVVLIFVTAAGWREGRLMQESYATKIYAQAVGGRHWNAIQITTAAGVCTMVDLLRDGRLPATGFLRQEDVALDVFLANRFGQYYQPNP